MGLSNDTEGFTFMPGDFQTYMTCESCMKKKMVGFHFIDTFLFFICATCR